MSDKQDKKDIIKKKFNGIVVSDKMDKTIVVKVNNIKIHSKTPEATDTFCTYDRGVTPSKHMFVAK